MQVSLLSIPAPVLVNHMMSSDLLPSALRLTCRRLRDVADEYWLRIAQSELTISGTRIQFAAEDDTNHKKLKKLIKFIFMAVIPEKPPQQSMMSNALNALSSWSAALLSIKTQNPFDMTCTQLLVRLKHAAILRQSDFSHLVNRVASAMSVELNQLCPGDPASDPHYYEKAWQLLKSHDGFNKVGSTSDLFFKYYVLPPQILELTSLKILRISESKILYLPDNIDQLSSLTELWAGKSRLHSLPQAVANMSKLTELQLYRNMFRFFPDVILAMPALKKLNIDHNTCIIPDEVLDMQTIEHVQISTHQSKYLTEAQKQNPKLMMSTW